MNPVTIITGGGRGIGRAIAERMSLETTVVVVGRTKSDLEETCNYIVNELDRYAFYIVGDVTNPDFAREVVASVQKHGFTIANLVCNAGVSKSGLISTFTTKQWKQLFDVNVNGVFYFIRECLPYLKESGRGSISIVSIVSSVAGCRGVKNDGLYSATKFAVNGMAESIADECFKYNISVVPICPGYVEGDLTDRSITTLAKYKDISLQDARDVIGSRNSQKRILKPAEVAEAVATVASELGMKYTGKPIMLERSTDSRILTTLNWLSKTGKAARKLIVPISGGTDSTLTFILCMMVFPEKTVGVYIGKRSNLRSYEYLESLGPIEYYDKPDGIYHLDIARWAACLDISHCYGGWLVGTRNKTESYTGLYSLASRLATFLPLGGLWKTDVMELCKALDVPEEILDSSRKADPNCGRPVELAEVPLEVIDAYIKATLGLLSDTILESIDKETQQYLSELITSNSFKVNLPTIAPTREW
jgi:NAD(P)-dependent dehydrogenase (short-subunit alcohol dehydrogenase family)/NH3-dependent NAD+ synthetase